MPEGLSTHNPAWMHNNQCYQRSPIKMDILPGTFVLSITLWACLSSRYEMSHLNCFSPLHPAPPPLTFWVFQALTCFDFVVVFCDHWCIFLDYVDLISNSVSDLWSYQVPWTNSEGQSVCGNTPTRGSLLLNHPLTLTLTQKTTG